MTSNSTRSSGGVGFCGMLAIVFIALKLTGHIAWSWWWVLAPIWAPLPIVVVLVLLIAVVQVAWEGKR